MPTPSPGSTDWVPLGPAGIVGVADELAYAEFTSSVAVSSTAEGTPNDVVVAPSITVDGATKIVIEFCCFGALGPTTAANCVMFNLWDSGTNLGRWTRSIDSTGVVNITPIFAQRELTPSAGAHTFKVSAWINSVGTGQVVAGAGGAVGLYTPGFIRIRRVSPYQPLTGVSGGDLVKIAEQILGGAQANIDFQNIPQTYRNLQFRGVVRCDNAAMQAFNARFNNISTGVYDTMQATAATTSVTAGESFSQTSAYIGDLPGTSAADAHYYATFILNLFNYAEANHYHQWQAEAFVANSTASGNIRSRWHNGNFRNIGGINRVTFFPAAGNLIAPSVITCYGMN